MKGAGRIATVALAIAILLGGASAMAAARWPGMEQAELFLRADSETGLRSEAVLSADVSAGLEAIGLDFDIEYESGGNVTVVTYRSEDVDPLRSAVIEAVRAHCRLESGRCTRAVAQVANRRSRTKPRAPNDRTGDPELADLAVTSTRPDGRGRRRIRAGIADGVCSQSVFSIETLTRHPGGQVSPSVSADPRLTVDG